MNTDLVGLQTLEALLTMDMRRWYWVQFDAKEAEEAADYIGGSDLGWMVKEINALAPGVYCEIPYAPETKEHQIRIGREERRVMYVVFYRGYYKHLDDTYWEKLKAGMTQLGTKYQCTEITWSAPDEHTFIMRYWWK
jgi:hypothetical protein